MVMGNYMTMAVTVAMCMVMVVIVIVVMSMVVSVVVSVIVVVMVFLVANFLVPMGSVANVSPYCLHNPVLGSTRGCLCVGLRMGLSCSLLNMGMRALSVCFHNLHLRVRLSLSLHVGLGFRLHNSGSTLSTFLLRINTRFHITAATRGLCVLN